jgi:methylenetetrahydrofolate dehydrogenase (NADP+) / methenyltetrahydrofolate cyclohydrolase
LTGLIIDGAEVAAHIRSQIKKIVEELKNDGIHPCLATILVGDDTSSSIYVNNKQKAAAEVGIFTLDHRLPSGSNQNEVLELVRSLNHDNRVHGILVQLPLPPQMNESIITNAISSTKDVDGLTSLNMGMLLTGSSFMKPCTPSGIIALLDYYQMDVAGMDAVIVNRSNLVGKPLAFLLLEKNATVTICHSKTKGINEKLKAADIIITAVGDREHFCITSDMVKDYAIVIDVGIARYNGKLAGDVDFTSVKEKASWITPVPGGVGPMTVCMLLKNTITSASIIRDMTR